MPLRLEIKRKLSARSERVKSVDFHPREPWVLSGLYSGHLFIWNYQTQSMVKSIEVGDQPVRCAKFIPRENWIICGADDMFIRVYNYNTMELVKKFEAHTDYIRCLTIHPSLPIVLSSSDDTTIKSWNWEKGWQCQQTFEGHSHYVMQIEINPKDTNTFASASLDRSVKIWGLNSSTPHFSLEGHERGVNCISYYRGGDRPYIVSGADDTHIKVWDYQTKACVSTLTGHTNNVSAVAFHPQLPIILSGAEDGTVRIWHSNTFRLENTLNYGMERVWSISCLRGANKVAIGYDDGTIMIKLGQEEPVVSMEKNGKVVWARNNDIVFGNVKSKGQEEAVDGERINVTSKDLGSCEIYPQQIIHNPNGRLLCVCGDGEYIIYTALSLKNKSFGNALEFVWATDSKVYATRESSSKIKVFKDFKEHKQLRASFAAEGIFGGQLLAARSADFVNFYDWSECRVVRRIDVCPRKIFWSETGEVVILVCDSSFFVLRYNKEIVAKYFEQGIEIGEQGIDNSFELENEIGEKVRTGYFVGDCFIYTNSAGKLNYYVGGEVMTLAHLTKTLYILGYQMKDNRVYLMDKHCSIFSYELLLSVLFYQTAIVRRDFEAAEEAMNQIPEEQHNRIARFLEAQDLKEMALEISKDPEHKFELALQCNNLLLAREMALESASDLKWKQLGDAALNQEFDLEMAEECFEKSGDLGGLLLLHTSRGDKAGMENLVTLASKSGKNNIAFVCLLLLGRVQECVDLLCKTNRIPEAAFLTRTYQPSQVSRILELWKRNLQEVSIKASEALADPSEYPELFEGLAEAVKVEEFVTNQRKGKNGTMKLMRAGYYEMVKDSNLRDLVQELKDNGELVDEGGFVEDDDDEDPAQSAVGNGWLGGDDDLGMLDSEATQPEAVSNTTETLENDVDSADLPDSGIVEEPSNTEEEPPEKDSGEKEAPTEESSPEEAPEKDEAKSQSTQENKNDQAAPAAIGDDFDLTQLDGALESVDGAGEELPSLDDLNSDLAALENMGDGWGDDF